MTCRQAERLLAALVGCMRCKGWGGGVSSLLCSSTAAGEACLFAVATPTPCNRSCAAEQPAATHAGVMPLAEGPPSHTRGTFAALQAVADDMARQAQQAQRFVQQDRGLTPAVCAVAAGPVPSVNQCLEGLADIA